MIKIAHFCIVYDWDIWPKILLRNFTLKNYLFGATIIVKNSDKEKYVYSGYVIAIDRRDEWSFGSNYARNIMISGVDNSSSSHTDNLTNIFLILGEGYTLGINGNFGAPENNFSINFSKSNTKFYYT